MYFYYAKKNIFKMHESICWLLEPLNSKILEDNLEREESINCR